MASTGAEKQLDTRDVPWYRRAADDEYLRTPRPGWYVEHTRRKPVEFSLDLNKVYSAAEFWEGISLVDRDPGMPVLHRHWCFNLVDTFTPALTSLNLEGCNVGDRGLEEFMQVLKTNTTLRSLNLKENNLSIRKINIFLDIIEAHNFTLCHLELDEAKKTAFAKTSLQHDSLDLSIINSEIMPNVADAALFQSVKKRSSRINTFNTKACKVCLSHFIFFSSSLKKKNSLNIHYCVYPLENDF
jgi:hypothetical protein